MSFLTDPFGFKRRRAARQALAERLARVSTPRAAGMAPQGARDEAVVREKLAMQHEQRVAPRQPIRSESVGRGKVQNVRTASTGASGQPTTDLMDPANLLSPLNPASPISIYGSGAHHSSDHRSHAPDAGCSPSYSHGSSHGSSHGHSHSHDSGSSSYSGGSDSGSSSGSDGGSSSGGCD